MSGINSIDSQELVSSKENIQPLRRGRDSSILCAALHAGNDAELQQELEKQRNEFEIKLRSNVSDDPLFDWCAYTHWIEQSFPRQGREGKLHVVLRKCIVKFKDCEKYKNDVRFVKLCMKYADLEENTLELLSQMHRHGIGVSCAELYVTWAEKYAVDNCYKKANKIYERGLQSQAQPLELLKEAHQNFQAFLVRKMLNERETFQPTLLESNSAEIRQPYNILQSVVAGSKELVPIVRTGQSVLGAAGKLHQISNRDQKVKNNKMIKVYEDSENNYPEIEPPAKLEKVPTKKSMTKENTMKPGPWTNKQNKNQPFTVEPSAPLPFEVHKDEKDMEREKKPRSVPVAVLKSHKVKQSYEDENFENAPLFYPEPYDPTKVAEYCKDQVYAGGLEFQFEELRAMQYRRKKELLAKTPKGLKLASIDPPSSVLESVPETFTIKPESHSKSRSKKKNVDDKYADPPVPILGKVGEIQPESHSTTKNEGSVDKRRLTETRRKSLFINLVPSQNEAHKINYVLEHENVGTTDYSMNQTIHTKEALSEMQQLWFSKPASPVPLVRKPEKPASKSILKPSKPCFSLYVDESCLENLKTNENPEKPLDLTLRSKSHSDSEDLIPLSGARKKTGLANKIMPSVENCKENVYVQESADTMKKLGGGLEVDDEDKENGIPADYYGPVGKPNRKVSGILTPAENVEIAPLSDEEVEEEEEEEEEEEVINDPSIIQCNTTEITETWNFTRGFQFPRGESTPNVRKSIHRKEDCEDSMFVPAPQVPQNPGPEKDHKLEEINDKTIVLQSDCKKPASYEANNFTKNLSVIAESSREYKSSSSGSSGVTSLPLRSSKNFPYTPSETKTTKLNLTSSQTTIHKAKVQSYTGYEASGELSQSLKTPTINRLNVTYDLMNKLNAIESCSISFCEREEEQPTGAESITRDIGKLEVEEKEEDINPFSDELLETLLKNVRFPKDNHWDGYILFDDVDMAVPRINGNITLGPEKFDVKKVLGEGSYARVFKLQNTRNGEFLVGKYQKPAFPWEFYITREVQERIQNKSLALYFMNVESGYFFKNCSILLTRPVEFGDLLSVINKMKQAKILCQNLAIYFTCQILKIVETLHSCKIIHGDVKPDNFVLGSWNSRLQLQLIDFGRSIDMSLFPENTTFKRVVTTEDFKTIEMRFNRPWTYQIDLYGVANCGHCLLFGDYMKVVEKSGVWTISKFIHRYWARNEWKKFFETLINVESCTKLPSLIKLREAFEVVLEDNSGIECSLSKLRNLLQSK